MTPSLEQPRPPSRRSPLREGAVMAGLLALVVLGLAGAVSATGWAEARAQVAKLAPWQVGLLLLLSLANYAARGLRWHLFARHIGLGLGLRANLRHFLGGFAMAVTPGRLGELVRMRWIARETGVAFERAAPLLLVDRASDLAAMAVLTGAAVLASGLRIAGGGPVLALALLAAVLATRPRLLAALARLGHRATGRFGRLFARLRRAARALAPFASGGVLLRGSVLALFGWLAEGLAFFLLLHWMGAGVSAATAIAIFLFATLAGGLTGAPGGLGGAEAAMVALLSLEGVPLAVSVPATVLIRLTTLWFAIAIGAAVFPVAERHSRRISDALD